MLINSQNLLRRYFRPVLIAAGAVIVLFVSFWRLDYAAIENWDEGLYGVGAVEMLDSGDYLVNTLDCVPDYYNIKPAAFWAPVAGMVIFGRNLFGLRFFSAAAMVLLVVMVFVFLWRRRQPVAAVTAAMLLLINPCNFYHTFRHCDPDGIFILLEMAALLCIVAGMKKRWLLAAAGFLTGAAFLFKTFHAGVFAIAAALWVLRHWKNYRWQPVIAAVLLGALPVLVWGFFRVQREGWIFVRCMIDYDLLGRVAHTDMSEHFGYGVFFYLTNMLKESTWPPVLLMVAGVAAVRRGGRRLTAENADLFWCCCWFGGFLLLSYSLCSAKLPWYIYPVFTILALPLALLAQELWCDGGASSSQILIGWRGRRWFFIFLAAWVAVCSVRMGVRMCFRTEHQSVFSGNDYSGISVYVARSALLTTLALARDELLPSELLKLELAGARHKFGGVAAFSKAAASGEAVVLLTIGHPAISSPLALRRIGRLGDCELFAPAVLR